MISILSFNDKPLKLNDKVYQVQLGSDFAWQIIELIILDMTAQGQLTVIHISNGKKMQFNVPAKNVHTDVDILCEHWKNKLIEQRDVVIPKQLKDIEDRKIVLTQPVMSEKDNVSIT